MTYKLTQIGQRQKHKYSKKKKGEGFEVGHVGTFKKK